MNQTSKTQEYRQDPLSLEWVVISAKRIDRPNDFKTVRRAETESNLTSTVDPFRSIVEEAPTDEVVNMVIRDQDGVGQVYNVMNKYPLVESEAVFRSKSEGPYTGYSGYGSHEVFVYREGDVPVRDFSVRKMEMMLEAFQKRMLDLMQQPDIKYVFVFHNHGKQAGASIKHPHSQLVASPIIPDGVDRMIRGAQEYHTAFKRSVFATIVDYEREHKTRLIAENDDFIAIAPYASKAAFEVEIIPKEHKPQYAYITPEVRQNLAQMYKDILERYHRVLGELDYNMYLFTAPCDGPEHESFRWFMRLTPRVSIWGGYESGADMDVCSIFPEDAARMLRDA